MERAYLEHLLQDQVPLWGLVRTPLGYLLLDRGGLAEAQRLLASPPPARRDLLSMLPRGRTAEQQGAETGLRRVAAARCLPGGLARMLARHLPAGTLYFNVGHSNLTARVMTSIAAAGARIAVMVHDVIPLEHPEFQRDGTVEPFRDRMRLAAAQADVIVYPSADSRSRVEAAMRGWGRVPEATVAHLGIDVAAPGGLPDGLPPQGPYFVAVGTLEPRKNIGFLLDLWDGLGPGAPTLLLCGSRGWKNADVFARLDAMPPDGPVRELAGLGDAALAALVSGANGLLFPTLAEGYGLPAAEAAALGTPILCNDLAVLRETLGNFPVYASVNDRYLWISAVTKMAQEKPGLPAGEQFNPPKWSDHFKVVLRLT